MIYQEGIYSESETKREIDEEEAFFMLAKTSYIGLTKAQTDLRFFNNLFY